MSSENADPRLMDIIESMRNEIARLNARVEALEATAPEPDALSDETIFAISAALAAYLGVKPHIRQIRLVGSGSWAQHGRATVQASHKLPVRLG